MKKIITSAGLIGVIFWSGSAEGNSALVTQSVECRSKDPYSAATAFDALPIKSSNTYGSFGVQSYKTENANILGVRPSNISVTIDLSADSVTVNSNFKLSFEEAKRRLAAAHGKPCSTEKGTGSDRTCDMRLSNEEVWKYATLSQLNGNEVRLSCKYQHPVADDDMW